MYFKLSCPKCGHRVRVPVPTKREIEAYRIVYMHSSKQNQAAVMMSISEVRVSQLLKALRNKRPDLFDEKSLHIKRKKPIVFTDDMERRIHTHF